MNGLSTSSSSNINTNTFTITIANLFLPLYSSPLLSAFNTRTFRLYFPSTGFTSHNRTPKISSRNANRLIQMAVSSSRVSCPPECNGEAGFDSANQNYAEILVVRHGETSWNSIGKIQGHLDVELNDTGRQQAAVVADHLSKEPKISAVYSSDLKRALETAEAIAKSCGGVEVIQDRDLRERHLGDLQGLIYDELPKVCTKAYEAFVSNRPDIEIPGGGESRDQLYRRSVSALQKIVEKHKGERVVVVSHGGFIRALYKRASPNARPGKVLNTSISIFQLYDGDKWVIKSWNDISHLSSTAFLSSGFGGGNNSG